MENITIQQVRPDHWPQIYQIIQDAFSEDPHSDNTEHLLVKRLVNSSAFIPELCLEAVMDDQPVGFVLVTRAYLASNGKPPFPILSLAPVCVDRQHQRKGLGIDLIEAAHESAKRLRENFIVLIGHDTYYPRFGYERAIDYQIQFPFDIPEQYCMVKKLGQETPPPGMVTYPEAFYG